MNKTIPGPAWRHQIAVFYLLIGATLVLPSFADESQHETVEASATENKLPEIGMSMKSVRQLLIGQDVHEELIGGACGMLEVISNDDNTIRVIGVGGVVTSVSEGINRLNAQNNSDTRSTTGDAEDNPE